MSGVVRRIMAAAAAAAVVMLPAAPATADGTAKVSEARVQGRQLQFTLSLTGLPAARSLDGTSTTVRVNGQTVPARTRPAAGSKGRTARAVLVVDTSGSMSGDGITAARRAALAFAHRVRADVPVGLIGFSDRPQLLVDPTPDRLRLGKGLLRLHPRGRTALYDAVALGVATAGSGGSVVVLSDGADTSSRTSLAGVTTTVRRSGASVSTVAFRTREGSTAPLRQLAGAGAGRMVAAADTQSLADAFTREADAVPVVGGIVADLPDGTRSGVVDVTVRAGTSTWRARSPFGYAAASPLGPRSALPSAVVALGPWYSSLWALLGVVFVAFVVLAWLAVPRPPSAAARRQEALSVYTVHGRRPEAGPDSPENSAASGIVDALERLLKGRTLGAGWAAGLDRAGSRLRPAEWLVLRACVSLAVAAVVTVLGHSLVLGFVMGAVGGWGGTFAWLRRQQVKRTRAFADALPDTLQLVASSLRTGFSLPQALDAVQQDGVEPIAGELGRALAAARIGAPLEDELDEVARRMQNDDWRWAVMAIRIQRSVGGNLAEVLLTTVQTLRERAATRRQVRALSAEGMLSAYILIGLPIFVSGVLLLFRREYLAPLWSIPGVVMVLGAVVLLVVGWFWMRKVVKVEV